ncbi:DEAD/DEAH box helicase [Pyramidobacter sp. SM-530-WT-4B]|uniref:DEAD/DEAH box helicase n=1 Tax=Pyramidobacter porci TaxID=2605789 RepID=A0A6L5YBH3_9BACT|nr:DEAD/DEAH box helicase [Pyramidobacter porci]MST55664.1 DEAD/DEAH box helicase [Pyramidobacter porci]
MRIKIGILGDNESFVITPIDFNVTDIRGIKVYLKNLNGGHVDNDKIIIPIVNVDVLDLYHKTVELFEGRFKCHIEKDADAGSLLGNAVNEEERFRAFSAKAYAIRNNNIDSSELTAFLDCVKQDSFIRTLKPFQILSAYHLAFSHNACNFSVPGAGKTSTVLAAYAYLASCNEIEKLLVVGPLASFLAWKKEYFYCFGTAPKVLEIMGNTPDKRIEKELMRSSIDLDLILVSYGSVSRQLDKLLFFLRNNRTMVVLDEAHRIKNVEDGVQSNATLQLSPFARSRAVLTGTPAPNSYVDLFNLYKFIWPSHNIIGFSVPQLANMSKREGDPRISELISRISPFYIRIRKSDLGLPEPWFLPPKSVQMSPIQDRIYDAISRMAVGRLEDGVSSPTNRLSAIIRLRQAASNPALLNRGLDDYYDGLDESVPRVALDSNLNVSDEIMDLIRTYKETEIPSKFIEAGELAKRVIAEGGKLVIWCEFVGTCDDLSDYLSKSGVENRILYGKTDYLDRERIINEFTDKEKPSAFNVVIANPHAVGESISLHVTCHNALYLEQSFNAGTYMQSKDRIHRVGLLQSDITRYYYIHSANTIDGVVFERVNTKEKRMLELIESQDIPLIANNQDFLEDNEDDIKAIIRGYYEYRSKHI